MQKIYIFKVTALGRVIIEEDFTVYPFLLSFIRKLCSSAWLREAVCFCAGLVGFPLSSDPQQKWRGIPWGWALIRPHCGRPVGLCQVGVRRFDCIWLHVMSFSCQLRGSADRRYEIWTSSKLYGVYHLISSLSGWAHLLGAGADWSLTWPVSWESPAQFCPVFKRITAATLAPYRLKETGFIHHL